MAEYHNPQQEPGTERRLLLIFALTFLVIMLFQTVFKKYLPQAPEPKPAATQQSQPGPQAQPATSAGVAAALPAKQGSATIPAKQASSESETVIENDLYRIVFTNRGGEVKSWVLKHYTDDKDQPLELVNATAAQKYGYPLSLWTYDESLRNKLNSVFYVPSQIQSILLGEETVKRSGTAKGVEYAGTTIKAPSEITFEYSDGDVAVQKIYKFDHSYVVEVRTTVTQKGAPVTAFPMWPSGFGDETSAASYAATQIASQYDSKVDRLAIKKISGGNTLPGPFQWAGVEDQYFAAVFLPQDPQSAAMVTLRNTLEIPRNAADPNNKDKDKVEVLGAAVGNLKGPTTARIFVGPKALPVLESVNVPGIAGAEPDLRAIVDFGWLGVIARPLFLWLKWTHNHMVANWGWAILLQTLVINLALLPLRFVQMRSMLKMQRIAPQIKAIQEKYKKYSMRDTEHRAQMNQEVSAMYKKEGVNPVSGCLPMLLPLFLLWPYYRMLTVAIDLRHAPWGWIRDLSSADPWHILPIAIIVTMLIMQRMMPQTGMDPAQQKMMNIMMPGMLGIMSWNLPAGLGLYWAAGQVIGIGQQAIMNRTTLGREMREMMEKRARKKDK